MKHQQLKKCCYYTPLCSGGTNLRAPLLLLNISSILKAHFGLICQFSMKAKFPAVKSDVCAASGGTPPPEGETGSCRCDRVEGVRAGAAAGNRK